MRKPDTISPADLAIPENLGATGRDSSITIEAPTVEEAMSRLAVEVGENARILSAEKVARGGIGGFFAKEMIVLTAQRPEADRTGLPGVLERMSRDADLREQAFGDVLKREMTARTPDAGLDSLLAAAGWDDATQGESLIRTSGNATPATDESAPSTLQNAGSHATDRESGYGAPPPVAVGPLVRSTPVPRPTGPGPMSGATIAERAASEHLVMTPDHFVAATFPVVTTATGSDAASTLEAAPPPPAASHTVPAGSNLVDRAASQGGAGADAPTPPSSLRAAGDVTAAPPGRGMPAWSVAELVRHGLPGALVTAVRELDPRDDMAWIEALAAAVEPWCGPLPDGERVIVGTGADRLAQDLDLPVVRLGDVAPYGGSFCSELTGAADDRAWLDFVRGGRHLHFVLGEDELWRDLLVTDPAVVSWVSPSGLVDALYLASTLGASLGYGAFGQDEPMVRCQPVDVALAIRRLVGRA